jgi:hypothetical protein
MNPKPVNGRTVIKRGINAQCMAQKAEAENPNLSSR